MLQHPFERLTNYQASFTTFVSATFWVHFCAQDLQDLSIIETILFKKDFVLSILVWIFAADFFLNVSPSRVLHGFTYSFVGNYEKASCSMRSKHLFYWGVLCISCQYLGLIKARSVDENRPGPGVQCIGANMLPVSRIASSFFALWAFSTTRRVLNAVVDSALGIVGINHKISSSDWMRSRLYALSFVDHSSYSNFHATGSFRKIDKLSSIFYDIRLSDLVGTFLCSRSARLVYHRNDPLQKGFCSVIQGFRMHKKILFKI